MVHSFNQGLGQRQSWVTVLGAIALLTSAAAEAWAGPGKGTSAKKPPGQTIVGPEAGGALVANLILALHQANVTGNYSVLRDLAAPQLHRQMTASDLADHFRPIRTQRPDLSAISGRSPEFSTPPTVVGGKILWMEGQYPTQPKPLRFKVILQRVKTDWRFLNVDVAFTEPDPTVESGEGQLRLGGVADSPASHVDLTVGAMLRGSASLP